MLSLIDKERAFGEAKDLTSPAMKVLKTAKSRKPLSVSQFEVEVLTSVKYTGKKYLYQ